MPKQPKDDVKYGQGMIHSHCGKVFSNDTGFCKHFIGSAGIANNGSCTEVEGAIRPTAWCELFAKAKT